MSYTLPFLILLGSFILIVSCIQLVYESRAARSAEQRRLRALDDARTKEQLAELYGRR